MTWLFLLVSCPPDDGKDTAEQCSEIAPDEALTALTFLRCEHGTRCGQPYTVEECLAELPDDRHRWDTLCDYDSFDPRGAVECILDLTVNPRPCTEEIPTNNDCHGMFTGYGCADI